MIWSITNYNGDCTNCIVAYFGSKLCHLLFILHQKSNCIYLMQDRPTMNIAGRWHDSIEIIKKDFEQKQQATVVCTNFKQSCMSNIIKPSGFLQPSHSSTTNNMRRGDCKRTEQNTGWRGSTGGPTSQRPKSNDDNDERTHKKTLIPLRKDV